jgi:hypothetical protein
MVVQGRRNFIIVAGSRRYRRQFGEKNKRGSYNDPRTGDLT